MNKGQFSFDSYVGNNFIKGDISLFELPVFRTFSKQCCANMCNDLGTTLESDMRVSPAGNALSLLLT